ncbi:MAG: Hsp20/alpha crystallin family protein [Promethearchaeota archaeon]
MCNENFYGSTGSRSHKTGHHKHGHPEFLFGACSPFMGNEFKAIGHMVRNCLGGFMEQYKGWVPYNLEDKGDHYLILVPLSGRTKEEVKVSLINNTLNITAEKPQFTEEEEKSKKQEIPFIKNFFAFVDVNLDIPLPADANNEAIKSIMQNGLLKVKVGKKPPRNININEEQNN